MITPTVKAPDSPKAALVFVHGMASHKKRYYPFMTYLAEKGYACVIYDQRGHGETAASPEELGYFGKGGSQLLIEDCLEMVRWTRAQYPGIPVFLFGHSMGSMVVRCLTKRYDSEIDGLIVSGTPSPNSLAGLGIFLTRIISLFKGEHYRSKKIAMLMFGKQEKRFASEGMHNAWLSSNKADVQSFNNDPLCGFKFTLNGYRAVMQLVRDTYSPRGWEVNHPDLPIHFVSGGNDPCMGSLSTFARIVSFIRRRGYKSVTSKIYPGLRHDILNEIGKEEVWRDLEALAESWL